MLRLIVFKMHADAFQPEKLLAVGPAAKVYRGIETATGDKVLLKVLLQDYEAPHPLDREKLQLLAPTLLQLRHPQIAGLITLLPTEDEFALVYEFMPGMNARVFAAERQPSPTDLRALAVQLMQALLVGEHLRQPHGDPKPSNLIIADHPGGGLFLQVQDWGLTLTRSVQSPETLWFCAPELHSGGSPTTQSDLFTAAASLFCLATNSAPAQGEAVEEILSDWRVFNVNYALSQMRPDLDQSLRDWLAWLLNMLPQQRPQSVAQALDVLMAGMHPGFTYMPQQAPAMAPGTQTAQLGASSHPNAPKPRPIVSKTIATTSNGLKKSSTTGGAAQPATSTGNKRSVGRIVAIVLLNVAALGIVGFFLWPMISGGERPTTPATKSSSGSTVVAANAPKSTRAGPSLVGRYVRVEIPGIATLNMAELQVFSGDLNLAIKGNATQSSIDWDGTPNLANDGNTDGNIGNKSVMHTKGGDKNPWWQVDLGHEVPLHTIVIWNRTDKDYGDRTVNLTVQVLDAEKKVVWEKKGLPKPNPSLELAVGQ